MDSREESQKKSDVELINLSLKDSKNYAYLMRRYEEKLMRYILRISGVPREDAEDVLQDVFIKVYQNLNGFDPKLTFSSWIYRIAHNETISHWRKKQARPYEIFSSEEGEQLVQSLRSDTDLVHTFDQAITANSVKVVLAKMDEKYREVLVLRFLEEKSYEEISDILKKPVGTIATLLNRAKKQFQKEVETKNISL